MSVELPSALPARPRLDRGARLRDFVSRRREILALVALLVLAAIVYGSSFNTFQVGSYGDDAHYIVTARALAMGKGFVLTNYPDHRPETTFPPGFPLLLTPVALLVPGSLAAFRIPSILFALGALPLWYVYVRRRLAFGWSLLIVGAVALNPLIVGQATIAMSEAAFSCCFALLLVFGDRPAERDRSSLRASLILAGVVTALYFIRTAGIAMVVATLALLVLRRRYRSAAVVLVIFLVPAALWFYRNSVRGGSLEVSGYQSQFTYGIRGPAVGPYLGLIERVATNASAYLFSVIPEGLSVSLQGPRLDRFAEATHLTWLPIAWGLVLLLPLAVGFVHALRERVGLAELSVLFYGALLCAWPWALPRFLHPVLPLLYLYLFLGLTDVARALPRLGVSSPTASAVAGLVVGVFVVINLARDGQAVVNPVRDRITDLSVGTRWIAQNAPASSIVITSSPIEHSLYTERLTVDFPSEAGSSPSNDLRAIREAGAAYVMIGPPLQTPRTTKLDATNREVENTLNQRPDLFRVVYLNQASNVRVYEVTKSDVP